MKIFEVVISVLLCVAVMTNSANAYSVFAPEGKNLKVQWAVLQSKEGKMNEMGAIGAKTVAKYTQDEKGTYSLYGGVDQENHNFMRLLEIYEDEEAYQVHRSSEGFKQYVEQRAPILEKLFILPVDPIVLEQKSSGIGSIITMALFEVKPECLEDFKTLITTEMKRAVADEDGVLGLFATSEQGDKGNRIHTMEIFSDANARERYLNSQHWNECRSKVDTMLLSRHSVENLPTHIILSTKGLHLNEAGTLSEFNDTDPEFVALFNSFSVGEVVAQSNLDARTRFMAILATLLGCQGVDEFRAVVPAALDAGLTPTEVKEVIYQSVAYLGIGRVRPFLKVANEVLANRGVKLPLPNGSTTTPETRLEKGNKVQIDLFGEWMRELWKSGPEETRHINLWLADNCFGDYYTRNGLDYKQREMITFCILSAQGGCEPQLTGHATGNFKVGNDKAFLIDVISQCLPYIGYPRSLNAIQCVNKAAEALK